jgi:BASS family bile acid:Na+ symporter
LSTCEQLDAVRLHFSPEGISLLELTLFFIMYGVALELRGADFLRVLRQPREGLAGLFSQILLLPALTLGLVWLLRPCPSMALGMFLVAACPGGNISNFLTSLARGNVALSVSLSAVSTLLAVVTTPLSFAFWSQGYPPAAALLREIALDPAQVLRTVLLILALPMALGMLTAQYAPAITARIRRPARLLSILIFAGYVISALALNWEFFLQYISYVAGLVILHNALALAGGYAVGLIGRLPEATRRTISIETGIQNSGLALALIFSPLFDSNGGMAMIAALWGIWHILSGMTLALLWSRWQLSQA